MSTLTAAQKFAILQHVSGHFLTEEYPDNWEDMTEEEQDDHLTDHVWEPLEDTPIHDVYHIIDDASTTCEWLAIKLLDGEI